MKVNFNTIWGVKVFDAETMTSEEFKEVKGKKDTTGFVYLTDKDVAYYNNYTCLSSYRYGGNCNCISHPSKHWTKFNPHTGMAV